MSPINTDRTTGDVLLCRDTTAGIPLPCKNRMTVQKPDIILSTSGIEPNSRALIS